MNRNCIVILAIDINALTKNLLHYIRIVKEFNVASFFLMRASQAALSTERIPILRLLHKDDLRIMDMEILTLYSSPKWHLCFTLSHCFKFLNLLFFVS